MAPYVTIVTHPAVQSTIEQLQDRSVQPATVRALVKGATNVLAVEATLEISPSDKTIIVPVMRSGLAMLDATLELLDSTHNLSMHHLGLSRHLSTLEAVEYYDNISTEGRAAKYGIIVDPLLATGSTVTAAINSLKQWKVENIIVIALIITKEAIERISKIHTTGVQFYVGSI
ncbi:hypothetical protein D6D17_01901, partial [Aureobasidium pullulans]